MTKHKQAKALKRSKQLRKQKGGAGVLGYKGKRQLALRAVPPRSNHLLGMTAGILLATSLRGKK